MADADSLNEPNSDFEQDTSAIDGDIEDDETPSQSLDAGSRKKSKKKKRKPRDMERSSGDSDSQQPMTEEGAKHRILSAGKTRGERTLSNDATKDVVENASGGASGASADKSSEEHTSDVSKLENSLSLGKLQQLQKAMELINLSQGAPKNLEEASRKQYQFWSTQPVPKLNEKTAGTNEAIEADRPAEEIRKEAYSLPSSFMWDTLDINDPLILKELYNLLNENYVEDDDNMFRFDYSPEFLQWALQPPGWLKEWHCGVRVIKSGKLVGFISAVPAHIKIYDHLQRMVEINFLCVHKKLRLKRVAPVLIREITRRVHCQGIFQAVYTAGVVLPKPVSSCRYWHRSLNPRKLIEVKFSHLSRNMTMQRTLKLYKLPENTKVVGFRAFTPSDVTDTYKLTKKFLTKFDLSPVFTEEEFRHWFIPRPGIVDSYVVETDGQITDFVSYYTLPSTVMHHPTHKTLKAAYSFYNVSTVTPWVDLMQDALISAKNTGFDVFNALDLMDNKEFLEKLKFGIGDGNLQYYLYNWRCPDMRANQVGLVLQ